MKQLDIHDVTPFVMADWSMFYSVRFHIPNTVPVHNLQTWNSNPSLYSPLQGRLPLPPAVAVERGGSLRTAHGIGPGTSAASSLELPGA